MNRRFVFYILGQIVKLEAAFLALPLIVAICYGEQKGIFAFLITICIALAIGFALTIIFKTENKVIYAKEGLVIVALAWIAMSAIGAIPFVLSGDIPSYVDAFFETVSGFTTTGASILTNVEEISHGALFWRSFTHWIGGMGVLVFIMAIIPSVSDRSIHIMRAEMPGPIVGKIVPRAKQTAKILYLIYIALTVIEIILLLCGNMSFFDSVIHTFGTAGTGGFGAYSDSLASFSPYSQWVITVFMVLFGVNFNLYFLILIKRFRSALSSGELWCYIGILVASTAIISANIYPIYNNLTDTVRHSAFQVSSIMTTTGFSTVNFDTWPELSKGILLALMFIGACAGSTGGGLKVSRIVMFFKMIKRELKRMIHPRSISTVRFEGKTLDDVTLNSVSTYFVLYILLFALIFLLLCFEPFDFETNFSAVAACINNIGPGFGMVGPAGSFAAYSAISKIALSVAMLLGRLEIYPLLFALIPTTWTKK